MPSKKVVIVYTKKEMIELARNASFQRHDCLKPSCKPEDVQPQEDGSVIITIHETHL